MLRLATDHPTHIVLILIAKQIMVRKSLRMWVENLGQMEQNVSQKYVNTWHNTKKLENI